MIRYPVLQFGRLVYSSQQILFRNQTLVMSFSTSKNHKSWNDNTERYLRTLNDYALTLDKTFYEQISPIKISNETESVTMYYTTEDLMEKIREGQDISETLDIVQNLVKVCPTFLSSGDDDNSENKSLIEDFGPLVNKSFKESIKNHRNFALLIKNIEHNLDKINETSSLFHMLSILGVDIKDPLMSKVYCKVLEHLQLQDLNELTNFICGLYNYIEFSDLILLNLREWPVNAYARSKGFQSIISRYKSLVDDVKNLKDLGQHIFCAHFIGGMLSEENIEYLLEKVDNLIDQGILDPKNAETKEELNDILDCNIRFISLGLKSKVTFVKCDTQAVEKCLKSMDQYIHLLDPIQVFILARVVVKLGKPAHLYNDLIKRLKNLAKNPTISQDALFLLSKLGINDKSLDYFSENFQTILKNPQQEFNVGYVIMILSRGPEESLKTYLNEVFENFKDNIRELSRIAFYLQVSQKTVEFSEKLTERLLDHIQRKPITDLTLFCIQFSFIVQNNDRVPYWLISKMVDLVPQLSIRQVSFILSHNKNPKWKKHMEFRQALKTRIMDIITEESAKMDIVDFLSLINTAMIFSSELDEQHLQVIKESGFFQDIVKRCDSNAATGMIAKAISRRSSTGFELEFCQEVLDSILDYYLKENSNVHTMHMMTGVKALYYTRLGPGQDLVSQEKVNQFMGLVSSSFVKDFDAISGRKAVLIAVILGAYHHLKLEIVRKIFSADFIETIDLHKYRHYFNEDPELSFHTTMLKLNRIVCILYPEYNLPWYYDDLCESRSHLIYKQKNDPELLIALVSLVNGDPNCVRELVYSDYWSHIHYELAYDTIAKKFCPLTDFNENNTTLIKKSKIKKTPKHVIHIAIINYKRHNYKPYQKMLKDTWTLEKYLLEHEGFKVIEITPFGWERMGVQSGESTRVDYLRKLLLEQGIDLTEKKEMCG